MRKFWFSAVIILMFTDCQKSSPPTDNNPTGLLLRGDITLCGGDQFGDVNFTQSCNEISRANFNLGISLLHSYEYEEAEKAFAKVIDADPICAMGYWGVAMSNFHSLWLQSGTDYLDKGEAMLALTRPLKKTKREQDYLDAIEAFYTDWHNTPRNIRIRNFETKMEALYHTYSADKEAAIFYALALTASADPADKTYVNQKKAGQLLEGIFPAEPNHPGIAHYIIHCYDYPELADRALSTARQYALIAPSSAHAQHMPSHIFTRLGLWNESISSNLKSVSAATCYAQSMDPAGHWDEELHGMDYLVYAYLQTGDNQKALDQLAYLNTFKKVFPVNFKIAYAEAAIPARLALENRDWKAAADLVPAGAPLDWQSFPWEAAITHFARGLGAVHLNDLDAAENEITILDSLRNQLVIMNDAYKANQVQIQQLAVEAWYQYARGNSAEAVRLMKESADKEYNTSKHPVTPCEVLPASELLADLYLVMGNYGAALEAYEFDLQQHPNRRNGLKGAAAAAVALGDKQRAEKYSQLISLNYP